MEKEIEQLHAEGKLDDLKAKAKELVEMKDKMMSILGPLGKLV